MSPPSAWKRKPFGIFADASIGTRLFVILLIALLPLALIDVFASQRISHIAQLERQRILAQNVENGAQRLNNRINRDISLARNAASRIALGEEAEPVCARLRQTLDTRRIQPLVIVYGDSTGRPTCMYGNITPALRMQMADGMPGQTRILSTEKGILLTVQGRVNLATAVLYYPARTVYDLADPVDDLPVSRFELSIDDNVLPLTEVPDRWLGRMDSQMTATKKISGLTYMLRYEKPRATSPEFLALALPFLIITAASIIVWLVANRMLIDPMKRLQSKMRRYKTGELIAPMKRNMLNASEIEELDNAFFTLTQKVAVDKHALDSGLNEQIRLTREVHHRVKNNLQIIASLISLHSRIAETPQELSAYAKIQRRVDALSVVQRNHYAGSEESRGISLRALTSELAGSFQAIGDQEECQRINVMIDNIRVDQDIAVPVAFLLTEILDLIQQIDSCADVTIDTKPLDDKPGKMLLTIQSPPLGENAQLDQLLAEGIDRVLTGLARQLRTPFNRDRDLQTVCVEVPVFKPRKSEPTV